MTTIKLFFMACSFLAVNQMNGVSASDDPRWDLKNAPSDYFEREAWRKEREKFYQPVSIRMGNQGIHIDIPVENGELKKGKLEGMIRMLYSDSRKIWFTYELGVSPGFLRSFLSDELMPFITFERTLQIFQDPKSDVLLTNSEIDPSVIKKSIHFYTELLDKNSAPDEEIVSLKEAIVSFIRHIQPISEEEDTFEAIYDESVNAIFSKENEDLRHATFYSITREDILGIANLCLNDPSPFDEEKKVEIRQALVDKGFLTD